MRIDLAGGRFVLLLGLAASGCLGACTPQTPPAEEAAMTPPTGTPPDAPPEHASATAQTAPATVPVRMTGETRAEVDPAKILARAVEKKGGAERLSGVRTVVTEAESDGRPMRITIRHPDRYLVEYPGEGGAIEQRLLYDARKDEAHIEQGGRVVALDGANRARLAASSRASAFFLLAAAAGGAKGRYLGEAEVAGRSARAIALPLGGGVEPTVFIDDADDLIALQYDAAGDRMTVLESDFRTVGGLRIAHRSRVVGGPIAQEAEVKSVEINPEVPDSRFRLGTDAAGK